MIDTLDRERYLSEARVLLLNYYLQRKAQSTYGTATELDEVLPFRALIVEKNHRMIQFGAPV